MRQREIVKPLAATAAWIQRLHAAVENVQPTEARETFTLAGSTAMRKTWRLQASSDVFLVIRRSDLLRSEAAFQQVMASLDRWLADPMARQAILEICEAIHGSNGPPSKQATVEDWRRYLSPKLEDAFRRGALILMPLSCTRGEQGRGDGDGTPMPPPDRATAPAPRPSRNKTWIEIELVDGLGNPVPNEHCRLNLPDGSVWDGRTDANGIARVDFIDHGECEVNFPNIDLNEWTAT